MAPTVDPALALVIEAGRAASKRALAFHMVNASARVAPYDRAALWRIGGRPFLLAASGVSGRANQRSDFALAWKRLIRETPLGMQISSLPDGKGGKSWEDLLKIGPDARALWLPLPGTNLALSLERWGVGFGEEEKERFAGLAEGYALAWRSKKRASERRPSWLLRIVVLLAVVAALVFIRIPLRVVAPCEVAARNPYPVTTPIDGVIGEVLARPGQMVAEGEVLALYEQSVAAEELEVARRQAEVVREELTATRAKALENPRLRSEAARLEARLNQETARLAMAESRWNRLRITAAKPGLAQMDDPEAWRGRPVAVGERVMWLVDPTDTLIRIWIPQGDRVEFDFSRPAAVHLDSYGGSLKEARLVKVGTTAQPRPDGSFVFPAEAEWLAPDSAAPLLGLTGTAVLYGPEVSLGYWLARKPMAEARRWLGL